jgi:hypothetical protein
MLELASAGRPAAGVPTSAIDPFSLAFLRDPHRAHEILRETGPIVWLDKYALTPPRGMRRSGKSLTIRRPSVQAAAWV